MKNSVPIPVEDQKLSLLAQALELLAMEATVPPRVRFLKDRRMLELLMSHIACGGIKQV